MENGDLRLIVNQRDGRWACAELRTTERLGLGAYQFWLIGRIDLFDPQLVFGFFPCPTPDVGPDGTNEVDIEFARWGRKDNPCGNFTVWPTKSGVPQATHAFPIELDGEYTTHRMVRRQDAVSFSSHHGHLEPGDPGGLIATWEFHGDFSRESMPLHLNFWLFQGKPPSDGRNASVVIRALRFE